MDGVDRGQLREGFKVEGEGEGSNPITHTPHVAVEYG